jgi:hypothetical protein
LELQPHSLNKTGFMKKLFIPMLALSLMLTRKGKAQAPAGNLEDTVAHASQSRGVVGEGALPATRPVSAPFFTVYTEGGEDRVTRRVNIHWQLASEFNTDHFVLERSLERNPTHFDPLHEIVSTGDSTGQAYDDRDDPPEGTISYYRLKVVLKNGEAFYSPVVVINMDNKSSLALAPSVLTTGGTLHFSTNTDHRPPVTVNFFDAGGRLMASYLVNSSYFNISTSGWTRGMYIYRISDSQHPLIESGKIMIM